MSLVLTGALLLGARGVMHFRNRPPAGAAGLARYYANLVNREPTAANFKLLAEASVAVFDYRAAHDAYQQAAEIYRHKDMIGEAYFAESLAQRYEVTAIPFVHEPLNPPKAERLALFEPSYGCFTGAFIDHEDSIDGTYRDEYGGWRRDATAFNHLTNAHHAIFFMYLGYGRSFPTKFVRHLNDNGAAAQIAWEPTSLDQVEDNSYLHDFARAARASRTPIFLRFASEMNGDWVPYHGDPKRYREKFQLVARVMHQEAPNVAMVWCPFETPVRPILDYYPGIESVDWVGVNIYSVPFWDNNPKRPADWRNPSDSLRYIYGQFAKAHPIMICEYAASHRSSLDNVDRPSMARAKMAQLYASLPRQYPRVKAVCWLSMNAIVHAIPGRQSNDYSLLDEPSVRQQYAELLQDPYFLGKVPRSGHGCAPQSTLELRDGHVLTGRVSLSAWVKLYDDSPYVVWRVNGEERRGAVVPGTYRWVLDASDLPAGANTVELIVSDSDGREVAHETRTVLAKPSSGP